MAVRVQLSGQGLEFSATALTAIGTVRACDLTSSALTTDAGLPPWRSAGRPTTLGGEGRAMVILHGADVERLTAIEHADDRDLATSPPGGGTIVTLALPLPVAESEAVPA